MNDLTDYRKSWNSALTLASRQFASLQTTNPPLTSTPQSLTLLLWCLIAPVSVLVLVVANCYELLKKPRAETYDFVGPIAKQFRDDRSAFDKIATEWTKRYAVLPLPPPPDSEPEPERWVIPQVLQQQLKQQKEQQQKKKSGRSAAVAAAAAAAAEDDDLVIPSDG